MDKELPRFRKSRIEAALPPRTKDRMEIAEPNVAKFTTLMWLPHRPKLLTDRLLAISVCCITETLSALPNATNPMQLI
jgi:hypothetical protein